VSDETARLRFRSLLWSLGHAKCRAQLIDLLRADFPVTLEDKLELAKLFQYLFTNPDTRLLAKLADFRGQVTPRGRGKPAELFGEPWVVHDAAATIRALRAFAKQKYQRKLTNEDAADVVCPDRFGAWLKACGRRPTNKKNAEAALQDFKSKVLAKVARSQKPEPKRVRRRRR
jgi:hypothetical protein